ncbi:bifunctional nuclease family protein [Rurimicrobium arvi]|uniref:Bifunctional nuclease family protein n=1 Tax=Rurimicrobium arvi TaxID=2049916 RepID=A0ABP8MVZ5_9BACT
MKKIELEIIALSHSITQNNSYAIVLGEIDGQRRVPIVIGAFEAQAIAVALERMQPTRPLTHDLFFGFIKQFDIELKEVIIYKLEEGIFFSKLVCAQEGGADIEIDSRTSDALALAVRAHCRIYTYDNIIESAGIFLNSEERPSKRAIQAQSAGEAASGDLKKMSVETLNELLNEALEQEDYVKAIQIRDELNTRANKD